MDFIQWSIEYKWPILLMEFLFLVGGILLITTGYKIRKQSKSSATLNIATGTLVTLASLYTLLITFTLGLNS